MAVPADPFSIKIIRRDGTHSVHEMVARLRLGRTGTGGGCRDPHARSHDEIMDDVRNGYLTPDEAVRSCGRDMLDP